MCCKVIPSYYIARFCIQRSIGEGSFPFTLTEMHLRMKQWSVETGFTLMTDLTLEQRSGRNLYLWERFRGFAESLDTLCSIRSVAMFCLVLSQKFRLPIGLHYSWCISPTASGTFHNYLTKYQDWPDATQCRCGSTLTIVRSTNLLMQRNTSQASDGT